MVWHHKDRTCVRQTIPPKSAITPVVHWCFNLDTHLCHFPRLRQIKPLEGDNIARVRQILPPNALLI
jgi:hypothetical protein